MKELYSRNPSEDLSEDQAEDLRKILLKNWEQGILVSFLKKDYSERKMLVRLNEKILNGSSSEEDPRTVKRRKTNQERSNQIVTEYLPEEDRYQIRTVPLRKVCRIEIV